ncbi:hypothetical protein K503DRAFT_45085 [Rhizopogon vinicolor AM-OR11-026]|uniref:Uncharacterized protein n=1 Tax=Rhizopogon vinicolor AM-OR11-026 TaxID=1314800 RepID=A0A1B7N4Z6_9AGAM|nr:hypothetical protein K503DRAFT_45085 [Rhizopogon vinicolor AM-OR11-026]
MTLRQDYDNYLRAGGTEKGANGRQRRRAHRLPQGVFDDAGDDVYSFAMRSLHPHSSTCRCHSLALSLPSRPHALIGRFSLFFHPSQLTYHGSMKRW